ncbi:MAG: ATP-binding cassette domain-containing protein, partial [Elusimicrobia bacterium]|nr:ATP-binding cassette domain-containing protein [Elusimicrobiota bacterium]
MLRVENLSKAYPGAGGPVQALERVTLQAVPGDIVCLIGPNASGKTTLLKILAGLVAPDSGRIEWT